MSTLQNPALDAATIRAIAREVARLSVPGGGLLTASEVAVAFNVTRGWVYTHADELGAIRLGEGPRPRLRFDPAVVTQRLQPRRGEFRRLRPRRLWGPASRCSRSAPGGPGVLSGRGRRYPWRSGPQARSSSANARAAVSSLSVSALTGAGTSSRSAAPRTAGHARRPRSSCGTSWPTSSVGCGRQA
jgi:hypothetical protein